MSYFKLRHSFHIYNKPYQIGGTTDTISNISNLSDSLVIFDIDGVLLRYDTNVSLQFSPIIINLFKTLSENNCKIAIATHGGSMFYLKHNLSPIQKYMNTIHPKYIKEISQPQYNLGQNKITMLNDLIKEGVKDYNIKNVIFFDDLPENLNSLIKLREYHPQLKLTPVRVHHNLQDIHNNYSYPLLRQISQRNPHDSIKNQLLSLIN